MKIGIVGEGGCSKRPVKCLLEVFLIGLACDLLDDLRPEHESHAGVMVFFIFEQGNPGDFLVHGVDVAFIHVEVGAHPD